VEQEDLDARIDGEKYAEANATKFWNEHVGEFVATLTTYSDAEAEEKLRRLREEFWSRAWERKR